MSLFIQGINLEAVWCKPWCRMVQTLELRGTNLSPPKSLGRYPKVFGESPQRLWEDCPKSLGGHTLYHRKSMFIPQPTILCTTGDDSSRLVGVGRLWGVL